MNCLCFIELCMIANGYTPADMNYMFVRSLRVFRVMRLAAASENLREVLMSAARSLKVIGAIAVVLLMFLYFMAIIAMQLFGGDPAPTPYPLPLTPGPLPLTPYP